MKSLLSLILMIVPWRIRRHMMASLLGYKIHPTAKIGLSFVCPDHLEMELVRISEASQFAKDFSFCKWESSLIWAISTGLPGFRLRIKVFSR